MRDDLTVLVQRIHPRADDFEIFEFFSQAGKVRDIRLIRDQRSNKSKGVGYVEFGDASSVLNALALNGIAFKGQPLLVQASMAEKNRMPDTCVSLRMLGVLLVKACSVAHPLQRAELARGMAVFSPEQASLRRAKTFRRRPRS